MAEPNLYQQPEDTVFIGNVNGGANPNINPNPVVKEIVKDKESAFLSNYLKQNPDKAEILNAPLTGKDINDLMNRYGRSFKPTQEQFELWKKEVYPEISASWTSQIAGAFTHLFNVAKETPQGIYDVTTKKQYEGDRIGTLGRSALEGVASSGFATYNMLAVEPNPDKGVINKAFKFSRWARSIAGSLTPEEDRKEQYQQFLEDYNMMHWYKDVASGKEGVIFSADQANPKVVAGASLAFDVLSFETGLGLAAAVAKPVGAALLATEAGQFVKMSRVGQTLGKIPEFTSAVKTGVVGGSIKYTGQALEFVGGTVKNTIKWGVDTGSEILESATGFDAKTWKSGIKFSGLGGSAFDIFSHGISGVGAKAGATLAVAGGSRMVGEGLAALGETILKNTGKRGFLTFAEMALEETPNLSRGAKGVLKAIEFADPLFSYASTATEGLLVGGAVGAGFGLATEGVKGIPSGIGGGAAFGIMGGLLGKGASDLFGFTRHQYGAIQAKFILENWKETKPDMHKYWEDALKNSKNDAERASIIQQITGIDLVAPNVNWYAYKPDQIETFLRERGIDMEGYKIDKETGVRIKDSSGNEVKAFGATGIKIKNAQGYTYVTEHGTNGEVRTQSVFIREGEHGDAGRHELAHTLFRGTKMYDDFMKRMHSVLLGKYNEKGEKLSNAHIDPDSFREFYKNYLRDLHTEIDANGKIIVDGETTDAYKQGLESVDKAIEIYKSDNQTLTTAQQKNNLAYFVEEFGAYYFDGFLKGKSIDWLFRGGKLKGLRGVFENIHDSYLERLANNVSRVAPKEMKFGTSDDGAGFRTESGGRVIIPQLDLMMRDLVRASAGNKRSKSFSLKDMTPEQRTIFIAGSGADGLNFTHDKDGNKLPSARTKQLRNEWGKKILASLRKLDPTIEDSFSFTHETSGFSDAQLAHLVNDGVFSKELANRIKAFQEACDPNSGVSNVFDTIYHGMSEEQIGQAQRKYGNDVEARQRTVVVHGYDFSLDAKGNLRFNVKTIDKQLMDSYGNEQWAKPEVRSLWGDDRNAFDKSVMDYLENASKDSSVRKESALLLDNGDGLGAQRRNVMHQIVAFAKKKSADYANQPTAEIPRIALHTRMDMSPDLMSHTESNSNSRYVYNDKNAFGFISENFKPSNMESEKTPQGKILKNEQGYSIIVGNNDKSKAYDVKGNLLGVYPDAESAGSALLSAYEKNVKAKERIIKNIPKSNEVQQGSFMVLSTEQRLEAIKRGNVWEVLKDWTGSSRVIPQTREEFYLQGMVELRQQDPKAVYDTVLSVYRQKFEPIEKAHSEARLEMNKFAEEKFGGNLSPDLLDKPNEHFEAFNELRKKVRRLELMLEYREPLKKLLEKAQDGKKPERVLTQINLLRQNSIAYDYIAKNIFGDAYDSQFQTGKPFATRATHGTTSEAMLGIQAELTKEGLTKNSRFNNPKDAIGAFLSGETKTSFNYSFGDDPRLGSVTRNIRSAIKMENPFVIDLKNTRYTEDLYSKIYDKARDGGHDGIVIKNVRDASQTDTVFIVMADKLQSNVVKLDSHKSTLSGNRNNLGYGSDYTDANSSPLLLPKQFGLPIGDGLMTYSDLGGNYKPKSRESFGSNESTQKLSDLSKGSFMVRNIIRQTGFDKAIKDAEISGRLIRGRSSTDFSERPVVIVNYDNSGVWRLSDADTKEVVGEIHGGAMHNIISGEINPDKAPAVLASVNDSGLTAIEEVRQTVRKGIEDGTLPPDTPLTFVINSGTLEKSLSHQQVATATTNNLATFLQQKIISAQDLNTIVIKMSDAFVWKKVGGKDIKIATGLKLKHLIGKTPAEQIGFIVQKFLPQKLSTFDERSSTMDRMVYALAKLKSVKENKDYFRKFFGNENFNPSGKEFTNEFLKRTDDPITRNSLGESIGYGKAVAVLEVPSDVPIISEQGGHTGFSTDYRSKKDNGEYNPAIMSILEHPVRIEDMLNRPSNKDIGTHYKTAKGQVRSTSEMIMTTTATFGKGVVKEGSHATRPMPTEAQMLTGAEIKGGFKVTGRVKRVLKDIDNKISDINNRSVVSSAILSALDKFKEALRKQDATDEVVVKEVEQTHTELLNAIDNEMESSSEATLPDLRTIKKKVEAIDRGLKDNQKRIGKNEVNAYKAQMDEGAGLEANQVQADNKSKADRKAYADDMAEGADLESQQAIKTDKEFQHDMETGAEIESEQAFDANQARVAQHEANMAEGADIESEQSFDARNPEPAPAPAQAQPQPQSQPAPVQTHIPNPWRYWSSENLSKDSGVWKNAVNYTIILLNSRKYKVYNPSGKNIGIYDDLEQAKRRVQRDEPKAR